MINPKNIHKKAEKPPTSAIILSNANATYDSETIFVDYVKVIL